MQKAHPATAQQQPSSAAIGQGRYITTTNAFRDKLPPVPALQFTDERDRAFAATTSTGVIACDIADRLASPVPATTPMLLAKYVRIRSGDELPMTLSATAGIYYVIRGAGESEIGADRLQWSAGDIFCLPGGRVTHQAEADAVLWLVSNEPELAFHRLPPPGETDKPAGVHFPAAEIGRRLEALCATPAPEDATGRVIIFTTPDFEHMCSLTPSMTLALNTLDPGRTQKAHRHNSVAVTLVIQGDGCHSVVNGERTDWQHHATMITPATAAHSHHNGGAEMAKFLIVQDGGIFYQCRAIGFSFA